MTEQYEQYIKDIQIIRDLAENHGLPYPGTCDEFLSHSMMKPEDMLIVSIDKKDSRVVSSIIEYVKNACNYDDFKKILYESILAVSKHNDDIIEILTSYSNY